MADKMPQNVMRQRLNLLAQLLFVTLTKDALSLSIGLLNIFIGMVFADGNQTNSFRQTGEYLVQMALNIVIDHNTTLLPQAFRQPVSWHIRRRPSASSQQQRR